MGLESGGAGYGPPRRHLLRLRSACAVARREPVLTSDRRVRLASEEAVAPPCAAWVASPEQVLDRPSSVPLLPPADPRPVFARRRAESASVTRHQAAGSADVSTLSWSKLSDGGVSGWADDAELADLLRSLARKWAAPYDATLAEAQSRPRGCETLLRHAVTVAGCLGRPNPVICAVAFVVLGELLPFCTPFVDCAEKCLAELRSAVFADLARPPEAALAPGRAPALLQFLGAPTYFELDHRLQVRTVQTRRRNDLVSTALLAKSLVLERSVRVWQRQTARFVLRVWRNTVASALARSAAMQARRDYLHRAKLLRKHMSAWRICVRDAVGARRLRDAKKQMQELLAEVKGHDNTTKNVREMMAGVEDKLARSVEERVEAEAEREQGFNSVDGQLRQVSQWKAVTESMTRCIGGLQDGVRQAAFYDDDARELAETVLLDWANTATRFRCQPAVNFSSDWKDGGRLLHLLRETVKNEDQVLPPAGPRRYMEISAVLSQIGVEGHPTVLRDQDGDAILTILFSLWHRYGHLPPPVAEKSPMLSPGSPAARVPGRWRSRASRVSLDGVFSPAAGTALSLMLTSPRSPPAAVTSPTSHDRDRASGLKVSEAMLDSSMRQESVQVWLRRRALLGEYALRLMLRRCRGTPAPVLTTREISRNARALGSFTTFCRAHLVPVPCSEAELPHSEIDSLFLLANRHFAELARVFSAYSTNGLMAFGQYVRFLSDTRLLVPSFRKAHASRLFARINSINQSLAPSSNNSEAGDLTASFGTSSACGVGISAVSTDEPASARRRSSAAVRRFGEEVANPSSHLVASEFFQLLVHLAVRIKKGGRGQKKGPRRISTGVEHLLLQQVMPNSGKSRVSEGRQQLWKPDIQEVFKEHQPQLLWLFRAYAAQEQAAMDVAGRKRRGSMAKRGQQPDPNTISRDEWWMLMQDFGLYDDKFTRKEAAIVFSKFQDEHDEASGAMVFSEFEEALCYVAQYKITAPYLSVATRVKRFVVLHMHNRVLALQQQIEEDERKRLQLQQRRRRQSSLLRSSSPDMREARRSRGHSTVDSRAS